MAGAVQQERLRRELRDIRFSSRALRARLDPRRPGNRRPWVFDNRRVSAWVTRKGCRCLCCTHARGRSVSTVVVQRGEAGREARVIS
ncbi:hypothetical protein FM106_20015 [Brachybacterium faecium]|nr:hypothetical protein FM106_20015 [Brachybacterium faecium]